MPRRLWITALLGAMLVWFLPLGSYRLFNPDEGRYAEIAREMAASGDWVTPRLDALRYFEKPPLQYWATAATYQAFGESEWSARLWAALTGFLGLLLTGWIGSRLYGAIAGTLAALVQAGALLYLGLARILTLDMGLTVTLELALCGLLLLVQQERKAADSRLGAWLLALGVALAFLAKGLVGILIPGVVALLYVFLRGDWGLVLRARPWWTLLALAVLAAPWVLLVEQRNPGFAQFFFVHEHFTRFLTRVHQRYEPDWFFIPVLLLGFMPWTPLLPAIARCSWRDCRSGHGPTLLLATWLIFGLVFFSLSQSKLVPYILPLFPALALLTGRSLATLAATVVRRALLIGGAFWLILGLAVLLLWHEPGMAARLDLASGPAGPAIASGFLLAALLTAVAATLAPRRGVVAGVATATLGSLALLTVLLPAAQQMPGQRGIAALITAAAAQLQTGTTIYCVNDYEQSIPFYLKRPCTLVGYRGELDFGLRQEPERWIPDLGQFAVRWQGETQALALIRAESYPELRRMGLPMRVIYTAPSLVAVVRK
jgi:4-amino-4-deoxy-L-arabinose transferase-like glycosyltransferase